MRFEPVEQALRERVAGAAGRRAELPGPLRAALNLCEHAGIDLAAAMEAKIARNEARYPVEQVRGRLEKHDEY